LPCDRQPKAENDDRRTDAVSPKSRALSKRTVNAAERWLSRACPVMSQLIVQHGPCSLATGKYEPFKTLVTSIIGQQLSAKAADTIKRRVLAIVAEFTPAAFLNMQPSVLRDAGLSTAKTRYILELSNRVIDGRLDLAGLTVQPDEAVIAALTDLPGVGRWTAEMFLIFSLRRPDVLSLGDAGLQRATKLLYGENVELGSTGEVWRPYRSIASWYLWRHLDS